MIIAPTKDGRTIRAGLLRPQFDQLTDMLQAAAAWHMGRGSDQRSLKEMTDWRLIKTEIMRQAIGQKEDWIFLELDGSQIDNLYDQCRHALHYYQQKDRTTADSDRFRAADRTCQTISQLQY